VVSARVSCAGMIRGVERGVEERKEGICMNVPRGRLVADADKMRCNGAEIYVVPRSRRDDEDTRYQRREKTQQ